MADNLLTEIQEDVNRERMAAFYKANAKYIYTVIALFIIGIAGFEIWKSYDFKQRTKSGDELYKIISNFSPESDLKKLQEISTHHGYKEVGAMIEANLQELKKNEKGVEIAYKKIANDVGANQGIRELAALNLVSLKLNKNPADASAEADLKKLSSDNSVYRFTALEILASYYKRNGKVAESKAAYKKIADAENAPGTISGRAKSMANSF